MSRVTDLAIGIASLAAVTAIVSPRRQTVAITAAQSQGFNAVIRAAMGKEPQPWHRCGRLHPIGHMDAAWDGCCRERGHEGPHEDDYGWLFTEEDIEWTLTQWQLIYPTYLLPA